MKNLQKLIFAGMVILSNPVLSQHSSCDGSRYLNVSFLSISETLNVEYGENKTMGNVNQKLIMDIYEPEFDVAQKRPLIILIHGGAFYLGNRQEFTTVARGLAFYGYVTATIDYRLIDIPMTDSSTVAEGMVMAVSDAKAAVRYFMEDAATSNTYKIDTNFIFLAGGSAGGITASQLAYLSQSDNIPTHLAGIIQAHGGLKGNSSTNLQYNTPVKGVLNLSGALWRKDWISNGDPPLFSAHDDMDTIVYCGYGPSKAFPFPVYFYGNCDMQAEAAKKGIYRDFFLNNSSGHIDYLNSSSLRDTLMSKGARFCYNLICTNLSTVKNTRTAATKVKLYPNPANQFIETDMDIDFEDDVHIELYNAVGSLVKKTVLTSEDKKIQISELPAGLYYIRYVNKSWNSSSFIKN